MKKSELPEGAEVHRIESGDTVIIRSAHPVPAEAVAVIEDAFKKKLPAGVHVIVIGPDAEITIRKGAAGEGQ